MAALQAASNCQYIGTASLELLFRHEIGSQDPHSHNHTLRFIHQVNKLGLCSCVHPDCNHYCEFIGEFLPFGFLCSLPSDCVGRLQCLCSSWICILNPPMPDVILQSMIIWQFLQDALDFQRWSQTKLLSPVPPVNTGSVPSLSKLHAG